MVLRRLVSSGKSPRSRTYSPRTASASCSTVSRTSTSPRRRARLDYSVIDLYGRGYSDAPQVPHDPNLYAIQLALLLQYLRWDSTDVVGFSLVRRSLALYSESVMTRLCREEPLPLHSESHFRILSRTRSYSWLPQACWKYVLSQILSCMR